MAVNSMDRGSDIQRTRLMLLTGVLTPILYAALLYTAGAFYPDFSHIRQLASELGADGAPYGGAPFFNVGLMLVGCAGFTGGIGLFKGLRVLGKGVFVALIASFTMSAPYLTLVTSGLFPLPSPWHANFLLVLAANFAPVFGAVAVFATPIAASVRLMLVLGFVVGLVVFAMAIGVGELVVEENRGLFWRAWAAVLMPLLAALCWSVREQT